MRVKDLSKYKHDVLPNEDTSHKQFNYWMLSPVETVGRLEVMASMGYHLFSVDKNSVFYFVHRDGRNIKFHISYDKNMSVAVLHENYTAGWVMVTAKGNASLWMNMCGSEENPVFSENPDSRNIYFKKSLTIDFIYILMSVALVSATFLITINIGMNIVYRICQGIILGSVFLLFSWNSFYRSAKIIHTLKKLKGLKKDET